MNNRLASLAVLLSFAVVPAALADNLGGIQRAEFERPQSQSDWRVTLGAGAMAQPEYEGADEYEVTPLPFVDVTYKDRVRLNFEGLNVKVINQENFNAGVGVGLDFGREDDDGDRLRGLGDIDPTAEGRLFAEYKVGQASAKVAFAQDLGDGHDGYTIDADAGYGFVMRNTGTFVRPSVGATFAGENYMESYFGVSAAQSVRSGLSQYDSDAGFKDINAGVFVTQKLNENWSVNGLARFSQLLGDAADSPIVEDESQLQTGLFVAYTF